MNQTKTKHWPMKLKYIYVQSFLLHTSVLQHSSSPGRHHLEHPCLNFVVSTDANSSQNLYLKDRNCCMGRAYFIFTFSPAGTVCDTVYVLTSLHVMESC